MTTMTDIEIRERLARLEEGSNHRDVQLSEIQISLDRLLADMYARQGRDSILSITHTEDREDKFQIWGWMQAFIPSGVLSGIWFAVWSYFFGGGQ